MSRQKFHTGDLVKVCKEFPNHMRHFSGADEKAIVVGSYKDQYGTDDVKNYSLKFKNHSVVSWYEEDQLTLIRKGNRL